MKHRNGSFQRLIVSSQIIARQSGVRALPKLLMPTPFGVIRNVSIAISLAGAPPIARRGGAPCQPTDTRVTGQLSLEHAHAPNPFTMSWHFLTRDDGVIISIRENCAIPILACSGPGCSPAIAVALLTCQEDSINEGAGPTILESGCSDS